MRTHPNYPFQMICEGCDRNVPDELGPERMIRIGWVRTPDGKDWCPICVDKGKHLSVA